MNRDTFNVAVESLPYGKKLPNAVYIYVGEEVPAPNEISVFLDRLRSTIDFPDGFNVLKLGRRDFKLSLLSYPEFFSDPHPALCKAMQIDLNTGKIQRTKYSGRPNPPILHRKEAFLPPGHPKILEFSGSYVLSCHDV